MENAYTEGYFYFDPEDDGTFPPYPAELDLANDEEYVDFDNGYNGARFDYVDKNFPGFFQALEDLLDKYGVNVENHTGLIFNIDGKDFKVYIEQGEDD